MDKKKINLNKLTIFLYSIGIALVEYLLLDLILTDLVITEYRMDITIGLLLAFFIIGFVTVVYMSEDMLVNYKEAVLSSKLNIVFSIIGIVSIVILSYIFLDQVLFRVSILPIIIFVILCFVIGRIIEKKNAK